MQDYNPPSDTSKETAAPDSSLSIAGQLAMQGSDLPAQPIPETPPDDQPSDINAQTADTELGYGRMIETGVEKPEVRHWHDIVPEGIYGEVRGGKG